MIGKTISHYQILEKLGAGGMGEVYRAEDANLSRQVAIKVLPDEFAHDAERLARFQREAQVLASLNHPNIATLYGLEESDGKRFIVMELVEGQTLAHRLLKGPLPVEEALEVCRQIAEGLESAHEKGVVHRDLKPGNVMITADDKIKILDFGLAKALAGDSRPPDATHSPTITEAMTRPGVIMGTAAYMSPEQARGKPVDKRSDIWSFGCILFECLAGKRAFEGANITETLASVLKEEPDWQALPPATPSKLWDLLRRCLQKDPRERLRDIGDARIEIAGTRAAPSSAAPETVDHVSTRWRALPWAVAIAMTIMAAVFALRSFMLPDQPEQPTIRSVIPLPEPLWLLDNGNLAISPDGRQLAYVAGQSPTTHIYYRSLSEAEFKEIPGTEGGISVFFSPDGTTLGFFVEGKPKKVPVAGGAPTSISETVFHPYDVPSWGTDDNIFFGTTGGILRMMASDGIPHAVTAPDSSGSGYLLLWPQPLPAKNLLLCTFSPSNAVSSNEAKIVVERMDGKSTRTFLAGGTCGRYLPTGHLIYGYDGNLMAAPVDLVQLRTRGAARRILNGIWMSPLGGQVQLAVSDTGNLIYAPGVMFKGRDRFALIDRHGRESLIEPPGAAAESHIFSSPAISPDGHRMAILAHTASDNIHVYDPASGTFPRVTFEGGDERAPAWTPDSALLAYTSVTWRGGRMFLKAPDGSGNTKPLFPSDNDRYPCSFSPDGKTLAFVEYNPETGWDIWTGAAGGDGQPTPFLQTANQDAFPAFSPDGQWIAYQSNESGQMQIHVAKYPDKSIKIQISQDGGTEPHWVGREIFYLSGRTLKAAATTLVPTFKPGKPIELFPLDQSLHIRGNPPWGGYSVMPDGQKFLFVKRPQPDTVTQLNLVINWFEELKRLCPTGK